MTSEQKAPYLQKARDNRSVLRMKKAQQVFERYLFYDSVAICVLIYMPRGNLGNFVRGSEKCVNADPKIYQIVHSF